MIPISSSTDWPVDICRPIGGAAADQSHNRSRVSTPSDVQKAYSGFRGVVCFALGMGIYADRRTTPTAPVVGQQLRLFDEAALLRPWVQVLLESVDLAMSEERDFLSGWVPLVLEGLRVRYASNPRTAGKVEAEARRLLAYFQARGVDQWAEVTPEMVSHWCWVSRMDRSGQYRRTAQSTARNRQWVATSVFDVLSDLGAPVHTQGLVGDRIPRRGGALGGPRFRLSAAPGISDAVAEFVQARTSR